MSAGAQDCCNVRDALALCSQACLGACPQKVCKRKQRHHAGLACSSVAASVPERVLQDPPENDYRTQFFPALSFPYLELPTSSTLVLSTCSAGLVAVWGRSAHTVHRVNSVLHPSLFTAPSRAKVNNLLLQKGDKLHAECIWNMFEDLEDAI